MKNIIIRECTADDAYSVFVLNKEEMGYEYDYKLTKEKLTDLLNKKEHKIFVAVIDNNVAGYVHSNDYDVIYSQHMKNIMGIAVSNKYRKLGVGKALLSAVEEWAKKSGACGIRLCSGEKRIGAHEFYCHCGYFSDKKQLNFKKLFS